MRCGEVAAAAAEMSASDGVQRLSWRFAREPPWTVRFAAP